MNSALTIRELLGRKDWDAGVMFGPDGYAFRGIGWREGHSIIVTRSSIWNTFGPAEWVHASIARNDQMPTYEDLQQLHRAVWGAGHAYQVFVPPTEHVNIHENALHLWGRDDGARVLPEFALDGSI